MGFGGEQLSSDAVEFFFHVLQLGVEIVEIALELVLVLFMLFDFTLFFAHARV